MNPIKSDNLRKELDKLELISEIVGTAIVNRNGLTISSNLPINIDERKFGAMAATICAAMESAISTLSEGLMNLTVEYDKYQLLIFSTNKEIIIASLTELNIDLGLIFIEMEGFLKRLQV